MSNRSKDVVYRAFDAEETILYVGVTCDPRQRFTFHEYQTYWWHLVDRIELSQKFADRQTAENAEALAIDRFDPIYNRHRPAVPAGFSVEFQFEPYEYSNKPNWPAVMRRLDSGSLVIQLPCPSCAAPSPDLMPADEVLVIGDKTPEPFCTDPYHFPGMDPESAARVHANRDLLRQQGILRPAEMRDEVSA